MKYGLMAKSKSTASKKSKTYKQIIAEARKRLPSERTKIRCDGCFNPRNTLTVKGNLNASWTKDQIVLSEDKVGVILPCSKCSTSRFLSLSKFSLDVYKADIEEFNTFVLLKDDKYNALIGIDLGGMELDLKDLGKK